MTDFNNIYTVLGTAVTVLGGASAWRFYEKRAERREKDDDFVRKDCRERISKLEALLAQAGKEKDEMRVMILDLTKQVAALTVKVEFLTKENDELNKKAKPKGKQQLNG